MRLFIAINFAEETGRKLLAVQHRLGRQTERGNFTRAENLHLTLAFLGKVAPNRLAAAWQAMERTPVSLCFDHMGCFRGDGGDIWWIGLRKDQTLLRMRQALTAQLTARDFRMESRVFRPHLTLAREVLLREPPDSAAMLGEPFLARADKISLMRSQRIGGLLCYTELTER